MIQTKITKCAEFCGKRLNPPIYKHFKNIIKFDLNQFLLTVSVKSLSDACTKHIFHLFSNHFLSSSADPLFLSNTHLTDTVFVEIVIVPQNGDFVWHSSTYTRPVVYLQRECSHVTEYYDIFPQNFIQGGNDNRPSGP